MNTQRKGFTNIRPRLNSQGRGRGKEGEKWRELKWKRRAEAGARCLRGYKSKNASYSGKAAKIKEHACIRVP